MEEETDIDVLFIFGIWGTGYKQAFSRSTTVLSAY